MRRTLRLSSTAFAAATLICACADLCAAQSPARSRAASAQRPAAPARAVPTASAQTASRGEADEEFELNIPERHITEQNFFASTSVEAGDESAGGLALRVGVAVGAERIDVLLRNVQGHVRFRASLDALRRVLDARRPTPPPNASSPPVP